MNRRDFLSFAGSAAIMGGCASSDQAVVPITQPFMTLPYRLDYGRRLIVTAFHENGAAIDFIVDTASTKIVFFENVADRINPRPVEAPAARIFGFSSVFSAPYFQIGDIRIGEVVLRDLHAPILSDWPAAERTPQGVLGLDVLSDYVIVVRKDPAIIEFYEPDTFVRPSSENDWRTIALTATDFGVTEKALYTFELAFTRTRRIPFLLDTGSNFTACNFPAAEYLKVLPMRARTPPRRDASDVHGERVETYVISGAFQQVGGIERPIKEILISDASFFTEIGYGDRPFGIFGLDSLLQTGFGIDFRRGRLLLQP